MSRHGYIDNCDIDNWNLIRWRGQVASAIRGKRGQALLRELREALDAMPEKRLIAGALVDEDGEFCALGCLGARRGLDMSKIDYEEPEQVAAAFGVAKPLICELEYENDESIWGAGADAPERRWKWIRTWIESHIIKAEVEASA